MNQPTDHIRHLIAQRGLQFSDAAWAPFASIWKLEEVKRKTILTSPGQVERNLYFVVDGVQRVYYLDDLEREATLVLTYPYSFAGVVDSFLTQTPARCYFETLSGSLLLKASHDAFQQMIDGNNDLKEFVNRLVHATLSGLLERMTELQCYSSEEKFKRLLSRSPQVLQWVPHKYLANYLGIDPTNFSKLINTVKL